MCIFKTCVSYRGIFVFDLQEALIRKVNSDRPAVLLYLVYE